MKGTRIVKLCDFGSSRYLENNDGKFTSNTGTQVYRAPEVDTGEYNEKIDIFSIGKVAREMLDITMDNNYLDMKEMKTTFIDCLHGHAE